MNESITEITKEEAQVFWVAWDKHPPAIEPGDFRKMLIEAFFRADHENFAKLESVFPEVAAAVKAWSHGDLAQRVKELGGRP